jgi:hypothetical protein
MRLQLRDQLIRLGKGKDTAQTTFVIVCHGDGCSID